MEQKSKKAFVLEFYKQVVGERKTELIDTYVSDDYIQHSPSLGDGKAALKEAMEYLKQIPKTPTVRSPVVLAIEDDDLVLVHMDIFFMGKRKHVVDIFRVRDGKITEHWDAIQDVAEDVPHFESIPVSDISSTKTNKALIKQLYTTENIVAVKERSGVKVHRILGEGNLVAVQAEGRKKETSFVLYDLYQVTNGVIETRWTIEQEIPATMAHANGMI